MSFFPSSPKKSPVKPNKTNPNAVIQDHLQQLHAEQEKTVSDIYSLEQEKQSILSIMPKVYYELDQLRQRIEHNSKELAIFDNAIEEIEKSYGDFLFSADFFSNEAS